MVYAMARFHPSLSVTSRSTVEMHERVNLVLAWEFSSTYPTVCYNEILIPPKIRVLPSGTFSQTLDFLTEVDDVVNKTHPVVKLVDYTCDGRHIVVDTFSLLHVGRL